jgi:hypothetical protein
MMYVLSEVAIARDHPGAAAATANNGADLPDDRPVLGLKFDPSLGVGTVSEAKCARLHAAGQYHARVCHSSGAAIQAHDVEQPSCWRTIPATRHGFCHVLVVPQLPVVW